MHLSRNNFFAAYKAGKNAIQNDSEKNFSCRPRGAREECKGMTKADEFMLILVAAFIGVALLHGKLSKSCKDRDAERFANVAACVFYIVLLGVGIASCTGAIDLSE